VFHRLCWGGFPIAFSLSDHEGSQFCLTFTDMHSCLLQNEDGCLCTVFVFPIVGE
jgi:hypothetical protein